MAQIIRSGAFLQQCWSVHPLCVTVKRMADDRTLVLSCSSCTSAHHLTLGMVVPKDSAAKEATGGGPSNEEDPGESLLSACIATHQASITLREMDVFQDLVLLRCADCRRHYELTVSSFETHQR
ncbi:MAG: hypothetical protein EWM72_02290 [Nitrospira sp.]|nr:MAG: hypothetical protein EWM72_02290 [Nitrospira sp.]